MTINKIVVPLHLLKVDEKKDDDIEDLEEDDEDDLDEEDEEDEEEGEAV